MLRRFEKSRLPITGGSMRGVVVPNSEPVHDRLPEQPVRAHHRERERDHREEQAADPQRREADHERRRRPRPRSRMITAGSHAICDLHVPQVERHRDVEAGAQHHHRQRAEADERELAERQLAGPAGQRRDRQRDAARRSRCRSTGTPGSVARGRTAAPRGSRTARRSRSAGAGGRTRAIAGAPGSASPARRATSPCRHRGSGRRPARARARRRRGRGRRSTGRATRRWRARCARTRRRRCRRRCVIGSDCMRAISATTSARSSSEGPIATRAGRDDVARRDAQQRCDQDPGDRRERSRRSSTRSSRSA